LAPPILTPDEEDDEDDEPPIEIMATQLDQTIKEGRWREELGRLKGGWEKEEEDGGSGGGGDGGRMKEEKEISFPSPGRAYLFGGAVVVIREWIRHWRRSRVVR
jgi:hypothetical protein